MSLKKAGVQRAVSAPPPPPRYGWQGRRHEFEDGEDIVLGKD